MRRLLTSLAAADYYGDTVALTINLEQTADIVTQAVVRNFVWRDLRVRHRVVLGGLLPAIVESWYPHNNDSYGLLLEDDIELSPHFYAWLKFTVLFYRYTSNQRAASGSLFGISLYAQHMLELRPEGRRPFNAPDLFAQSGFPPLSPYRNQVACSWGALYFGETWREFHTFLGLRLAETSVSLATVILPNVRSNAWHASWKRYHHELAHLRGYTMLYPNFPHAALSTNHLEVGVHNRRGGVGRPDFTVPLLDVERSGFESILDLPDQRLPAWEALPVVDFWGHLISQEELSTRAKLARRALHSCPESSRVEALAPYNARDLLCTSPPDPIILVEAVPVSAAMAAVDGS